MLTCTITSLNKNEIYKNLKSVTIPASSGSMEILNGHAEAFIIISKGKIVLKFSDDKEKIIESNNGECHVKNNKAIIVF